MATLGAGDLPAAASALAFGDVVSAAGLAVKGVSPAKNFVVKKHQERQVTGIWKEILADTKVPVGRGGVRDARRRVAKDIVAMQNDPHELITSDAVRRLQVQAALGVLESREMSQELGGEVPRSFVDDLGSQHDWDRLTTRLTATLGSGDAAAKGFEGRCRKALELLGVGTVDHDAASANPQPDPQTRLGDLLALLMCAKVYGDRQRDWQELLRWWQSRDRRWRSSTALQPPDVAHDDGTAAPRKAATWAPMETRVWGRSAAVKFVQASEGRRELGEFRAALEDETAGWLARELELRRLAELTDLARSVRRFVRLAAVALAVIMVAAVDATDLVDVTQMFEQIWDFIID